MAATKQSVYVRRLTDPTEEQAAHCAALMEAAFGAVTYDNFGETLSGGNKDLDILILRAGVNAGFTGGEVYVAGFTEDVADICALAIWFGPGTDYLAT